MKFFRSLRSALGHLALPAMAVLAFNLLAQQAPSGVPMTIEGLVRDVACPMQNHKSTATSFNLDCAVACAKSGSPLIILTKTDEIYFPISEQMPDPSQREKLIPFVGKYVRATGTVYRRGGTRTIAIKNLTELKDVKLNTKVGGD
jgi:hypothetical protein